MSVKLLVRVGGARPPPFITFTITSKVAVYAPAEWADTLTLFHLLNRYVLCGRNYTCVLLPLYILSDLLPPPPPPFPNYIQTVCVCVGAWGGGEVLNCTVDHILQEFYTLFLTRFRTYKIASPPQTKMTSKDDIKGLVSLKFLRPWG